MARGKKTGGRKKGAPNKTTADVREVIAAFAKANAERMHEKLNEIDDPAKWIDAYLRAIEYHIPKLGRTEVTGKDGGPVVLDFGVDLSAADK
jgi:hypothetical protein